MMEYVVAHIDTMSARDCGVCLEGLCGLVPADHHMLDSIVRRYFQLAGADTPTSRQYVARRLSEIGYGD